jgi:hypothetical protein
MDTRRASRIGLVLLGIIFAGSLIIHLAVLAGINPVAYLPRVASVLNLLRVELFLSFLIFLCVVVPGRSMQQRLGVPLNPRPVAPPTSVQPAMRVFQVACFITWAYGVVFLIIAPARGFSPTAPALQFLWEDSLMVMAWAQLWAMGLLKFGLGWDPLPGFRRPQAPAAPGGGSDMWVQRR